MACISTGKHLIAGSWCNGANTVASASAWGLSHAFAVGTTQLMAEACAAAEDVGRWGMQGPRRATSQCSASLKGQHDAQG